MSATERRFFVPEVIQASAMDCGPAVLKALLEGFGIPASYGRLREACQTDVDGTAIETLVELLGLFGMEAEQVMLPLDHVLLPGREELPAVAVVLLPGGLAHFVLAWRRIGPFVEVMDPATGRRWPTRRRFLHELLVHRHEVEAQDWREWAANPEAIAPFEQRLRALGVAGRAQLEWALGDSSWRALAALDAATRLCERLATAGGLARGSAAQALLERLASRAACEADTPEPSSVPSAYWSVRPARDGAADSQQLELRGVVLVRVRGRAAAASRPATVSLAPALKAVLTERETPPWRRLRDVLQAEGRAPAALALAAGAAALAVGFEALLFNGLLELHGLLALPGQRALGLLFLMAFLGLLLVAELLGWQGARRLGRHVEAHLRMAFLAKLPRLGDRYFGSRLMADMAARAHSSAAVRNLPDLLLRVVRSSVELIATAAAIAWLFPSAGWSALAAAAAGLLLPLAFQPLLGERDLRVRNLAGALSRFYLDALLGAVAIRAHAAARTIRQEHGLMLRRWSDAALGLQRAAVFAEALSLAVGLGLAAYVVLAQALSHGPSAGLLLLVYWALRLPTLGNDIADALQQLPFQRSVLVRLGEPLEAPEPPLEDPRDWPLSWSAGLSLEARGLGVRAGGHTLLEDVSFALEAGCHTAIVGPSGAGKSTLIGTLLGFNAPASGTLLAGGEPIQARLARLRESTAWVDPAVQIWNRSLLANLRYGAEGSATPLGPRVAEADLLDLLETLPEGLETALGEGGGLVSGGEGQRVRFGRALGRAAARLVLLDEPFRGLAREQRARLLARARSHWRAATLLCVTHDIAETRDFEQVLVLEQGRLVEAGRPSQLLEQEGSRYRGLLEAEAALREQVWSTHDWRLWTVESGHVSERGERP